MPAAYAASLLVTLVACRGGGGSISTTTVASASAESGSTGLGPGDIFAVRVYGETDLSDDYRVSEDGSIDFPLLGRVEVGGLESREAARLLERRLVEANVLVTPQVSILVREVNSRRVTVVGAVARAGTFPMQPDTTVVQAITLAGGFSPLASRNDTVVTRRDGEQLHRFRVRVDDVTRGRVPDFQLEPGDIVFVPQRAF